MAVEAGNQWIEATSPLAFNLPRQRRLEGPSERFGRQGGESGQQLGQITVGAFG